MKVITLDYGGNTHVLGVELTRRNLEVLLAKLDRPESSRTLVQKTFGGGDFVVVAVENEAHYSDREPGPMHPDDEAVTS